MSTPPPKSASRTKSIVLLLVKIVVATLLLTWLIRGGNLEFGKLAILIEQPMLLLGNIALFALAVLFTTLRWRALLGLAGVRPPVLRLLQLQLTGLFFNVVVPGNIGGDVIKALYIARDAPNERRSAILLIVFVERLIGLAGLILLACMVVVVKAPMIWPDPLLRPVATLVIVIGAGLITGTVGFLVVMNRAGHRLDAWTSGPSKISKLLNQIVSGMRLLSSGPKNLALALVFSMCAHGVGIGFFTLLTHAITHQDASFASIATIYPLGMLTLILPISPSGLGVGHVAFNKLFEAIGLTGGATVFNVYLIGQIAPSLVGVFPYIALKRSGTLPTANEAESASPTTTPT